MRIVAAFACIAMAVSPAAAQPSRRSPGLLERFEPYLRLVERYRLADGEEVVHTIGELSRWSRESVERAVDSWRQLATDRSVGLKALASRRPELKRTREPATLEAAALLHTVAGIVASARGGPALLEFHLAMARQLMKLRTASPAASAAAGAFDAEWNRAVALFFHGQGALEQAKPYMEAALALSPMDGELLIAAARLFEARHADGMAELTRRYDPGIAQSPGTIQEQMLQRARAEADIARAELLFRSAIAAMNGSADARLRLGRVLLATSRFTEAETLLQAAMTQSSGESADYLARLFLARMHEDRGHAGEAAALYEAATRMRPRNQSARIGLARVLAEAGRREESNALVLAAVTTERERGDEPWWLYYYPDESALAVLLATMRERLR